MEKTQCDTGKKANDEQCFPFGGMVLVNLGSNTLEHDLSVTSNDSANHNFFKMAYMYAPKSLNICRERKKSEIIIINGY